MQSLLPPSSGRCARSTARPRRPTPPLAAATPKRPPSRSGRLKAIAQAPARRGRPRRGGAGSRSDRWAAGRGGGAEGRSPGFPGLRYRSGLGSRPGLLRGAGPQARGPPGTAAPWSARPSCGCPGARGDLRGLEDMTGETEGPGELLDGKGEQLLGKTPALSSAISTPFSFKSLSF